MKMKAVTAFKVLSLWSALLFAGCASTRIQSVSQSPDFDATRLHKTLVVSIASTTEIRELVEREFVRQLYGRGVNAVASVAVLPPASTLDKAGIAPFAKSGGFDSVLVTRLVKREAVEAQTPDNKVTSSTTTPSGLSVDLNAIVASPEYGMSFDVAVLKTNLYDAASEKLMWSAVSQTLISKDVPKLVKPFTQTILTRLFQKEK